jgi:hypothetical protein
MRMIADRETLWLRATTGWLFRLYRSASARFSVPTVRESKNLGIERHDIENQIAMLPAAERRTFPTVLLEAEFRRRSEKIT